MVLRRSLEVCWKTLLAASAAAALACGCAQTSALNSPQFATRDGQRPIARVYRIGVGDKLKVMVFGEENLSGQFEVGAIGQISMPLIGEVPAKGLSIADFRVQLTNRLSKGYLKNPKVTVDVLNYRPIYVQGEVKNAGEFQFKNGLMMRDAIAMAGGYTYRADQSQALVVHEGEGEMRLALPSEIPVLPGDNIMIPERFF